jgi:predicted RNase H-like HicB family nuclease
LFERLSGDRFPPERYVEDVAEHSSFPEYLQAAMRKVQFERMENGEWFASIPGFVGLWAIGATEDEARRELETTLPEWIDISRTTEGRRLPEIDGLAGVPKRP